MLKGCGSRIFFLPLALIAQFIVLAGLVVLLRAGTGSLDNADHLPTTPGLYLVLLDTDEYTQKVGKETYKGLPDSHDFSKEKDFFGLFPALYCSGMKDGDRYEADYCSAWGKQLFDLQRLWRVWGVDLMQDDLIGSRPKLIYIGLLTTAGSVVFSVLCNVISFCWFWGAVLATILSWVSTIAAIVTTVIGYTFVKKLVGHIASLDTHDSGKIVAHWGGTYFRIVSIGSGVALLASVILSISLWRERNRRSKSSQRVHGSQFPLMGVVRRATGGFRGQDASYKHITEDVYDVNSPGKIPHQTTMSRSPSPEPEDVTYSRGQLLTSDTAYEPMRHHSG